MLKDLITGKEGESNFANLLGKADMSVELNDDQKTNRFYDLVAKFMEDNVSYQLSFEVKNDKMSKITGNIAIEIHNTKKDAPSGLMITESDIWVHICHEEIWICNVEKLKEFCNNTKPLKLIERGGDDNARLLIFKKQDSLHKIFDRIDNLDYNAVRAKVIEHAYYGN